MDIDDLLHDRSFRNWANDAVTEDCLKWERYLESHPEQTGLLLTARMMAGKQDFAAARPDTADTARAWSQMQAALRSQTQTRRRRRMIFIAAAACLLFGLVAGFLLMAETPQTAAWSVLRTEPGNLAEQILPDGTRVILNGNSRLQYAASIAHQRHREVILSGEAFFEVRHLPEHARFSVLTENARITVLGTDFNVCARGQRTAVSLLNGRVELGSLEGTEKQVLVPGNTAEISGGGVIVREDNVESRASWRKHIWVFNNTPLKEIVTRLEESYGIQVTIDTHVDLDRTISGTLSTKNLATLYKALEGMFDIRIVPSEQHILIRK